MHEEQKAKSFRLQKQSAKQYATTSFVGALIGLVLLPGFLGPVAFVSGIIAFIKGQNEPLSNKHKMFAILGIIISLLILYLQAGNYMEAFNAITGR